MGFWINVIRELDYRGINRKTLAYETGVSLQTINRAVKRDSRVFLDDALKIAKYLQKPVEYFLDEPIRLTNGKESPLKTEINEQLHLYSKYSKVISNCENLDPTDCKAVIQLAQTLAEKKPKYSGKH